MSKDLGEVFSAEVPIPRSVKGNNPPPSEIKSKPKRKYARKSDVKGPEEHVEKKISADAMQMAERLFDGSQIASYHMVKAFIELSELVAPENHKRLAMILDGLISK